MRLGREDEARKELELAYDNHFRDADDRELADADGQLQQVRDFPQRPPPSLKLNKKEADVLRPYFEEEMQRVMATYEKKYKYKLEASGAGGSLSGPRRLRRPYHGSAGPRRASVSPSTTSSRWTARRAASGQFPLGQHDVARNEPRLRPQHDQRPRAALVHRRSRRCTKRRRLARLGRPADPGNSRGHSRQEAAAGRGNRSRFRASHVPGAGDRVLLSGGQNLRLHLRALGRIEAA